MSTGEPPNLIPADSLARALPMLQARRRIEVLEQELADARVRIAGAEERLGGAEDRRGAAEHELERARLELREALDTLKLLRDGEHGRSAMLLDLLEAAVAALGRERAKGGDPALVAATAAGTALGMVLGLEGRVGRIERAAAALALAANPLLDEAIARLTREAAKDETTTTTPPPAAA